MGDRPDVETASAPIVALDVTLLAQQIMVALARVPFRRPFHGGSTKLSNLGASVTREVVRSFMGYASSLRVPEFRSLELVLDDLCRVVMPPVVATFEVEAHPTELGGVPGILYVPTRNPPVGIVLYLHGGGYIGTSPNMYAFFTARLCRATDCAVFVADYRLAPEFPFPAGLEDATAAYEELCALDIPAERIFLGGDSGGGGLVNSILLATHSRAESLRPAGLILFSPEVDLRLDEPSVTENADRDILPWNIPTTSYLHGTNFYDAGLAPLAADLSDYPPTCVTWGGNEMFRDPIRRYVQRLHDAGVPTVAHEYPGMFHVFQILMPWSLDSQDVVHTVRDFVHDLVVDAPPLELGSLHEKLGILR